MDGSRFFSRKGGLEDPRDIFVVFWGEGGGGPRSLFSIILLCDFNKFEFSRGGTPPLMHHHLFIIMILSLQVRTVPFHRSTTLPLAKSQNRRESPDDPWTNFRSVGTHSRGTEVVLGEWGQP